MTTIIKFANQFPDTVKFIAIVLPNGKIS